MKTHIRRIKILGICFSIFLLMVSIATGVTVTAGGATAAILPFRSYLNAGAMALNKLFTNSAIPAPTRTLPAGSAIAMPPGTITGNVYFDGNDNGQKDAAETGVQSITVRAYAPDGSLAASALTDNSGNYSLNVNGTDFRIEFDAGTSFFSAAVGNGSASSVQFAAVGATNVNYGLYVPGQIIPDLNARYIAACDASAGAVSVASWLNNQTFPVATSSPIVHPHNDDFTSAQVGVPFSFATKPGTKYVVMTPMASPSISNFPAGPQGNSALYIADYSGATNLPVGHKLLVKLDTIGVNVTAQFPIGTIQPRFGEYGLAGAEFSKDGDFLYVINMGSGKILKIDMTGVDYAQLPTTAPTAAQVSEITIPTSVSNTLGRYRPTTLTQYGGAIYVGGVDDATGEIKVLKMDPATQTFTPAFNMPPIFRAGLDISFGGRYQGAWSAGPDNTSTTDGIMQPFLTDIAFDDTGSMILGVTNRMVYNLQSNSQPGYVVRTWRQPDGSFVLENNKVSGPFTSTAINTNLPSDGPGGGWFFQNGVPISNYGSPVHTYLFSGGLLPVPGTKEIIGGYIDPIYINQFGARYLDWTNGRVTRGIGLGGQKTFSIVGTAAVADPGPIEVGNRVWNDTNGNGRQDPGEAPIAGVVVELLSGTTVLDTATTDANGNYVFSSDTRRSSTASQRYGIAGLLWEANYTIRILNATGASQQAALATLTPTTADVAADQRDSDGVLTGTTVAKTFSTGTIGENTHNYDFGFTLLAAAPSCEVVSVTVVPGACNDNGTPSVTTDDYYIADITVNFLNKPTTGTLDLAGTGFHSTNTVTSVAVGSTTTATSHTFVGVRLNSNNTAGALTASFSADPACALNFATPPMLPCSNPPCTITAITAPVGACNTAGTFGTGADDYYLSNVQVTFSGAPSSGYLQLTGAALASPNTVTAIPVTNLDSATSHTFTNIRIKANNTAAALTATFTANPTCTFTVQSTPVTPCSGFTSINVTPGVCNDNGTPTNVADDYYVSDVVVNFLTKPTFGNLTLNGAAMHASNPSVTIAVGSTTTATSHTFTGVKLKANGIANDLVAFFTAEPANTFTVQAPAVQSCFNAVHVGNLVFLDNNQNGFFDAGDTGIPSVEVQLWSPGADKAIGGGDDTQVLAGTDGDVLTTGDNNSPTRTLTGTQAGCYLFKNLLPGDYYVRIPVGEFSSTRPLYRLIGVSGTAGVATDDNLGEDGDDNLTDGVTSAVFALAFDAEPTDAGVGALAETGKDYTSDNADDNNTDLTIDFGFIQPYTLGNRVWKDLNNSGTIDAADGATPGIDGVVVRLLNGTGTAQATDVNGVLVPDAVTANGGYYRFSNLAAGDYVVQLRASNFTTGGILIGCVSSTAAAADPDTLATDSDDNGVGTLPDATNGIVSLPITLGPGAVEPTNESNLGTGDPAEPNATTNMTVDFGFVPTFTLGNRVWKDRDNSGTINAADGATPGVDNVAVRLLTAGALTRANDITGAAVPDQLTANGGYYRFSNLPAGDYVVEVLASNFTGTGALLGCVSSSSDAGDPDTDVDDSDDNGSGRTPDATNGIRSLPVTLGPTVGSEPTKEADLGAGDSAFLDDNANLTVDFGFAPVLTLGNLIWKDYDNDGSKDADEPGVNGVVVELLQDSDNNGTLAGAELTTVVATVNTATVGSVAGIYNFTNLLPGNYAVRVAASNFVAAGALFGCLSSTVSDPLDNNEDNDDNGIDNATPTTGGVVTPIVNLLGFSEPDTPVDGNDTNGNATVDLGFYAPVSLGNLVWKDLNNNGLKDSGEMGINGVVLELLRDSNNNGTLDGAELTTVVATQTTATTGGVAGSYNFTNLVPGNYAVRVAASNFATAGALAGCLSSTVTQPNVDGNIDNDDNGIDNATPTTGGVVTPIVNLLGFSEPDTPVDGNDTNGNATVDLGFYAPVSLGNLVWKDFNNNGLKDSGEMGINGVVLELLRDSNNNGTLDGAELTTVVATQTTATTGGVAGSYNFTNLVPGNYAVRVAASNFAAAGALLGCVSSSTTTTNADGNVDNDDNGIDNNTPQTNGIVTGIITLQGNDEPDTPVDGNDTNGNATVDLGFYAPVSLGNLVWKDYDNDGRVDLGEPGIDGVLVELLKDANANGTLDITERTAVGTATTANGGKYLFSGLLPGNYFVRLAASNFSGVLKDCISSTPTNATPNSDLDNDDNGIDPTNNATLTVDGLFSGMITLNGDTEPDTAVDGDGKSSNQTVDFGLIAQNLSLGNLVWKDKNENGRRDADELGIAGVTLALYRDTNGDGVYTANTDVKVASTTTDGQGNYRFSGLIPSTYFVELEARNFVPGGLLAGCISSTGQANPNSDVDNDDNGSDSVNPALNPPRTTGIQLVSLGEPVATADGDDNNGNLTADFGLVSVVSTSIVDPPQCTGPGSVLTITATVNNTGLANLPDNPGPEFEVTMPANLVLLANSATAKVNGVAAGTVTSNGDQVLWNGPLPVGAELIVQYRVQLREGLPAGTEFCLVSYSHFDSDLNGTNDSSNSVTVCDVVNCQQAGPGIPVSATGSVLIFPAYTSDATNPGAQNTRISITNADPKEQAAVHLFFVDGATCSIADSYVCLTPNQTAGFLMSDLDPGTSGYMIAVAVDPVTGCPKSFNRLLGEASIKYASGHQANVKAESVGALQTETPLCDPNTVEATLKFDGLAYGRLPRTLALNSLGSRADGNDTLLILNRIGGNLHTGAATLGAIFGLVYDDAEKPYSFTLNLNTCQSQNRLDNNFPRTTPRLESIIPAGRTGWVKLFAQQDAALIGVALNRNAGTNNAAFNGGHSLHTLTTTSAASLTIPVFPPNCR